MALQDILDHILAQAKVKTDTITKQADADVAHLREAAVTAEAEAIEAVHTAAASKQKALTKKVQSYVTHERKSRCLSAKRAVIDEAFVSALEQLKQLPQDVKEKMYASLINRLPKTGDIIPAAGDAALIAKVTKKAGEYKVNGELEASGGFVFCTDTQEVDFTFETIMRQQIEMQVEGEVAKKLFG